MFISSTGDNAMPHPLNVLRATVNRCIAEGAPVYVNIPPAIFYVFDHCRVCLGRFTNRADAESCKADRLAQIAANVSQEAADFIANSIAIEAEI
jgi:hypothetical protein